MEALYVLTVRFRLGELLEERGVSQTQLARDSRVSMTTINSMVLNKTKQVSLRTLDAICAVLGCAPGELLEREGPKPRRKGAA